MSTKTKYKICTKLEKKEFETVQLDGINEKPFDPFKERANLNPTTDCETTIHLLKASLGSGILSMPYAFGCAGLTIGLIATIITAIICTYCSYILVKCAHVLYYKVRVHTMSYVDVAEIAFANGPPSVRKWSKIARYCVMYSLFVTYFGAISCYTVIAGSNFKEVIEEFTKYKMDIRIYIISVLPPLILLGLIPNLKALAPFSAVANILISSGLGITIYYLVFDMHNPWELRQTPKSWSNLPVTFSITVFAMEAIGLMMPLENNMKNPNHFLGICGVLNRGMSIVSMVYILIGFIGYVRYGDKVAENITANLPSDQIAPQVAKVFIGISVLLTYVLQYFVCLEIGWNAVKDYFVKREKIYNSLFRTFLVFISVLIAVIVPKIGPFVSLIGALCFSFLGILFPVIIEIVTYWETTSMTKLILRNFVVIIFGIMALGFGTYTSLLDIAKIYMPNSEIENDSNILFNSTNSIPQ
ncbi:hypothetical protein PGB90_000609 [Kerria lacca]